MNTRLIPVPENIRAWVDALRNDDFQQTSGYLKVIFPDATIGYCCLGVSCELALASGVEMSYAVIAVSFRDQETGTTYGFFGKTRHVLPYQVANWMGLPEGNPVIMKVREQDLGTKAWCSTVSAVTANDSLHWSFSQIADCLEYTYLDGPWPTWLTPDVAMEG